MSDWKNVQYKDGKYRTSEGGGGGGSSTFAGLDDVSLNNLKNGQVPKYNSTTHKWENADESGGGGTVTDVQVDGVSVVNQQGVAEIEMPTPPTIPVEDVKVNGESVVDGNKEAQIKSYKEVTQAEYNALPDSKLNDGILYCIKDTGGADGFPPLIYSDEEREIGVWIDGKPLYEKTVTFGNIPAGTNNYTIQMGLSNVDNVIEYNGMGYDSANNSYFRLPLVIIHLPYSDLQKYSSTIQTYNKSADTVRIDTGSERPITGGYITIRYTKTTDVAGSGTWTTQGGYAHHYSTTEHIVGTWIDGKPIYEKTIQVTTTLRSGDNDVPVSTPNLETLVRAWSTAKMGNGSWVQISVSHPTTTWNLSIYDIDSSKVRFCVGSNIASRGFSEVYVTMQYTKTTD